MNATQTAPSPGPHADDAGRRTAEASTARVPAGRNVWELVGGARGAVDGGLPPLVFVAANALVGAYAPRTTALASAIAAAFAAGLAIIVLRLVRRETLKQGLAGLAGLTIAVFFAVRAGEARGFFLPGIYVDAAYAIVFAASAALGRPLIGTIYGLLFGQPGWRSDARLRRLFTIATVGWSAVYVLRAGVQAFLYREDLPALLAVGKLLLGWPLTVLAVVLTLAAVRRATHNSDRDQRVATTG